MFFHSPCLGSVRSLGTLGYFWVFGRDVDVVDVLLAPSKSRWCQSRIQTGNSKSSPHDLNLRVFEFCMVVFLCFLHFFNVVPQIAIAIGVLTCNRGGGRRTTLADWTWQQGAIAGCSGRGAIPRDHCKVLL